MNLRNIFTGRDRCKLIILHIAASEAFFFFVSEKNASLQKLFFFAFALVLVLICFFYKFLVVLFRLHSTFFVLSGVHNWYRQCFKQYLVKPKNKKKKVVLEAV